MYVESKSPNPDPYKFSIVSETRSGEYLVAVVNYPDATNYEGDKVLVFKGVETLFKETKLDPHFFKTSKLIARFKPDAEGIGLAITFVNFLRGLK